MKSYLIAVTALAVACGSATARLGETPEQIEARFGQPVAIIPLEKPATAAFMYKKNGFQIQVQFWNGKSSRESYSKMEANKPEQLLNAEVEMLLQANSDDSEWSAEHSGAGFVTPTGVATRKDGKVEAAIYGNSVLFHSMDFEKAIRALNEEQAAQKAAQEAEKAREELKDF